jgi:hypothetical protein
MYKGRGYEDACPEMAREKDDVVRDGEAGIAANDDGKGAG